MTDLWTTRRLVAWIADDLATRGVASARLDAELLAARALGCDRVRIYMDLDRPWSVEELAKVRDLLKRRRAFEPIAYILGQREFYGRPFAVDPRVLIPRPDTETLVDLALGLLQHDQHLRALDLCTGSGAIGVTLAAERPLLNVDVTDISAHALTVAMQNATRHGVAERVHTRCGDMLDVVDPDERYALIACNPPYIAETDRPTLSRDITDHEPALALFGGDDGLTFYRRIAPAVAGHLSLDGHVLLEVGAGQAEAVMALLRAESRLGDVTVHADLGGVPRVVVGRRHA